MTAPAGLLPKVISLVPLVGLSTVLVVDLARTEPVDVSMVAAPPAAAGRPPVSIAPAPSDGAVDLRPASGTPASVWVGAGRPAAPNAVVAVATADEIPSVALAAYQRAATVMADADAGCHVDWSLVAAIGEVESDHGRTGGNRLSAAGVATPGIVGPALTGSDGRMLVTDTDSGAYDGDTVYDHAVGPLQFLPSTWSVVGVDADGDGHRDPQDVEDAALAAAVYLCSGTEDLATAAGRQAAVLRYNQSSSYVDTVLATAEGYRSTGGVSAAIQGAAVRAMPVAVTPAVAPGASPAPVAAVTPGDPTRPRQHRHQGAGLGPVVHATTHPPLPQQQQQQQHPSVAPPAPTYPTPPQPQPQPPVAEPTPAATFDELASLCSDRIAAAYPDATPESFQQAVPACAEQLTGETLPDAQRDVEPLVATLPDRFPELRGPASPEATPAPSDPSPTPSPEPTAAG